MKVTIKENIRVEITADPGWLIADTPEELISTCESIVDSVKRHVDDIDGVNVLWDSIDRCSFCMEEWEDGEPACCDKAIDEWKENKCPDCKGIGYHGTRLAPNLCDTCKATGRRLEVKDENLSA